MPHATKAGRRAYLRRYYRLNRERILRTAWGKTHPRLRRKYTRAYQRANREALNAYQRARYKRKHALLRAQARKRYRLKGEKALRQSRRRYKLVAASGRRYGASTRGVEASRLPPAACECCGRRQRRNLSLDHVHGTHVFRGWLCGQCNAGIGMLGDTLDGLKRAIAYLERAQ